MQADLNLLPKRSTNKPANFKNADVNQFYTNYYSIVLDQKKSTIFQYVLDVDIPADSTEKLYKVVRSIKKELKEKIGLLSFRGNMLWGSKSSSIALNFISQFEFQGKEEKFEVLLKQTKELKFFDLLKASPQDAAKVIQVLNINTKQKLKLLKMNELGQGKFYDSKEFNKDQIKEAGLSVWRGYKFSLCMLNKSPVLQIDVCSRVLRTHNFLEDIQNMPKQQALNLFKGAIVVTRYGNHRTYKIQDLDYSQTPSSQFFSKQQAGKISYEKYYADHYMIKVQNRKQPLILAVSRIDKEIKNGKIVETPQMIFLIPEFVSLTGMSDQQRKDHNVMKDVAQYTKLSVEDRVKQTQVIIKKLNDEKGMYEIGGAKKLKGFILDQPRILTAPNSQKPARDGNIQIKDRIKDPAAFNDWVFVYSAGNKSEYDDKDADYAVDTIAKAQEVFGITSKAPGFIVIKGRSAEDWKREIKADIKDNGAPQIIVFFVSPQQQRLYGELKKFATNQIKIPSQFIRKRTLNAKNKTALSCASKIILQMNAKIGKPIWQVKNQHPYFKGKKIMYGALSLSKGKGGYTLAFVGTTNLTFTGIYSECKIGIKRKEQIPQAMLTDIFIQWAKNFYLSNNKACPDVVILYREGLSDAQIKKQLTVQVQSLNEMIKKIGSKSGNQKYRPQVVYMTANKKINSRFYTPLDRNNQGKFAPKLANPLSGSTILEEMSVNDAYDFHLVPQVVTQGTCTPTLYRIAYEQSAIPQEALVQFTFQQCFNYYNWQGAVRVPACLQCADKLSKLVGESIREDIAPSDLQKKHFFL